METTSLPLAPIYGILLGLSFHPLASAASVGAAGVIAGAKDASRRQLLIAFVVLLMTWGVADGIEIVRALAYSTAAEGVETADLLFMAANATTWAVVGFAVGYVFPAAVGRAVGRRVTHGWGWPSAAVVGVALSLALAVLFSGCAAGT